MCVCVGSNKDDKLLSLQNVIRWENKFQFFISHASFFWINILCQTMKLKDEKKGKKNK